VTTDHSDIAPLRDTFFRRTRRLTAILYVALGLAAVGFAFVAVVRDPSSGSVGIACGFIASLLLSAVSPMLKTTPRIARLLTYAVPVLAVAAFWIEKSLGVELDSPALLGAAAGLFAGTLVGMAWMRHRLATDDELLLRQVELGFDPENPWAWFRDKQ